MKRIINIFTLVLSVFCCQFLMAQDPVLDCASVGNGDGTICAQDLANFSIALSANAVLPNTEYVVVDPNNILDPDGTAGTGDEGPAVLGASTTGMFDPATFAAFAPGDDVCVIAVSFDVAELQSLIDAIYGNSSIPLLTCCTLAESQFAGLCTDLMNAGINSGADVTSLQDIITIASAFTGGATSLEAVVGVIATLNANLGTLGGVGCNGGVTAISYAIDGVTEADGSGTPVSCCITVLDNTDMACATATCAAITGVTASAAEVCDGDMVTVCVDFDAAADDVTVNGAGPAAAGDTQICYDVAAANMGCQPLAEMSTPTVVCTLDMMPVAGATAAMWTTYPNAGFTVTTNDDGATCGTPQIEVFSADNTSCGTVDGTACAADGDMETLDGATLLTAAPAVLACQLPDLTAAVTCAGCADPCTTAPVIACGDVVTAANGVDPVPAVACAPAADGGNGFWFTFVGTGDEVTLDLSNSDYDTQLALYDGSCGALNCLDADDDGGAGTTSLLTFISTAGTNYLIYADGFGGATGNLEMSVTCVPPPPVCTPGVAGASGVDCGNAIDLCGECSLSGTNVGNGPASDFCAVPTCTGADGDAASWLSFVGDGSTYTFNTNGSDFDTQLAVFSDDGAGCFTCEGGDDDGGVGTQSAVSIATTAGTTYWVVVDGFAAGAGNWNLNVTDGTDADGEGDPVNIACPSAPAACPGAAAACTAMAGEPLVAGNPAMPIEICQADAGTVAVMAEFNPSTGMDDNMNAVVTNYLGINNATNEIVSVANDMTTLDLSMAAPGDVICVQSVAYTQATLDNLTGAIDGVSGAIGIPPIGMVDLSGFLNFLTNFITVDALTLEDIFTNGVDLNTLTGIPIPDIAPIGAGIVCSDFSTDFYCVTILPGTDPACFTGMACDPSLCNEITFSIVSFDWAGLEGQFIAGLEGTDTDIELAYSFDGGTVFNVMGGAAGSDTGAAGTTFTGATTAPGSMIPVEVCFWENDCGNDGDYDNDTGLFGPCIGNADDPFGDSSMEGAATTCEMIMLDITATSATGTNYTVNYTASCTAVPCAAPVCDITDMVVTTTCAADSLTYDVTVTVTGADASVMIDDGNGPVPAVTTTFTGIPVGTPYTITVTDTDAACTFGPFTGQEACAPGTMGDIPTLSEWGLMTLALLLMTLGAVKMAVGSVALAGVGSRNVPMPFNASFKLPFDTAILRKALNITAILSLIGFAICFAMYGGIFLPDMIGVAIAGPIFAYLAHLLYILETNNK